MKRRTLLTQTPMAVIALLSTFSLQNHISNLAKQSQQLTVADTAKHGDSCTCPLCASKTTP